jgi:hypothetical protein
VATENYARAAGDSPLKPLPAILPPLLLSVRYHPVSLALWRAVQMPAAAILGPPPTDATALDVVVRTVQARHQMRGDPRPPSPKMSNQLAPGGR